MSEIKAWSMATLRLVRPRDGFLLIGDTIRRQLGVRIALEVVGPYDIVVGMTAKSMEELYRHIQRVGNLESVAGLTSYPVVKGYRRRDEKPNACILIDTASQDIESVLEEMLKIEEVCEADIVLGVFDVVAMATIPEAIMAQFLDRMRAIPGAIRVIAMPELQRR